MQPRSSKQLGHHDAPREFGRVGEGSIRRRAPLASASAGPLPGFEAYASRGRLTGEVRGVPGFQARSYRDFGHTADWARYRGATGIWGRVLPGIGPRVYRETSHGRAGTWGTNGPAATGILGMDCYRNPAAGFGFGGSNSVSTNSCINTPTLRCGFFDRGR